MKTIREHSDLVTEVDVIQIQQRRDRRVGTRSRHVASRIGEMKFDGEVSAVRCWRRTSKLRTLDQTRLLVPAILKLS